MWLNWAFAVMMLPAGVAFALCFAAGAKLAAVAAGRRGYVVASNAFFGVGVAFLAVAALAILWNMLGWLVIAAGRSVGLIS